MRTFLRSMLASAALVLAAPASALAGSATPYSTIPTGINDAGEIVGFAISASGAAVSFLYDKGQFTPLDFPGAGSTTPRAIDNKGDVVGDYVDSAGVDHGFEYANGAFTGLNIAVPRLSEVDGIDANGTIYGTYFSGGDHGFLYASGVTQTFDVAGDHTVLTGVSDAGELVGYVEQGQNKPFSDDNGYTFLPCPSGVNDCFAYGVNDSGTIVGTYQSPTGNLGYIEQGSQFTLLPPPFPATGQLSVFANAINDNGVVVGQETTPSITYGFVYDNGRYIPFNFTTGGGPAIPEPSTWMVMLVGLGGVGGALRSARTFAERRL